MTRRPRPLLGMGTFRYASDARMSASTAGCFNVAGPSKRTNRVCFPPPSRIFFGSGNDAPWKKQSATPFGEMASDIGVSDTRSVAEYPIARN